MRLPRTSRIFFCAAILLFLVTISTVSTAPKSETPQGSETAAWNVPLRANQVRPSTVTATNDCSRTHQFQIEPDHLAFMRLLGPASFSVAPKSQKIEPVEFDTRGLTTGSYDATLSVRCMDCRREPGCTEDHRDLHVFLTVFPNWSEIYPDEKSSIKQNTALRWLNISPDEK